MQIINWAQGLDQEWDSFLQRCPMATFLQSRRFLSYHGDRFVDCSLIIADENGTWLGVMPAAQAPDDPTTVVSHPGSTYGGIIHSGKLIGAAMVDAIKAICQHYLEQSYRFLTYKMVPVIYHQPLSQDDAYGLFRCHANLYRRDLSNAIDLRPPSILSSKAQSTMRRRLRKAENEGVTVSGEKKWLPEYWAKLSEHLATKYDTRPTHNLTEIEKLMNGFPNEINLHVAVQNDEVIGGTILFCDQNVMHTQYLFVSERGMACFALDTTIQFSISEAKKQDYRYFDFGISNEQQGWYLNQSLYLSKAKHGGLGVVHDFYQLDLEKVMVTR
jgi:hypothetical protein